MDVFDGYLPEHREALERLLSSGEWQEALSSNDAIGKLKNATIAPPKPPSQLNGAATHLIEKNTEKVRELIRSGETDENKLKAALGNWDQAMSDGDFPILFLGLVLTLDCCFDPKCLYCNQRWLPTVMKPEDWRRIVAEASKPLPPYVYMTGGEPLLMGEELWGDDGLATFATRLGCAVNFNTNATLITPRATLSFVKNGLFKIHTSIDTPDPKIQSHLMSGSERPDAVWKGIFNLQIARELLGAYHPQVHVNCVLTKLNLDHFPALVKRILDIRKVRTPGREGKLFDDPVFSDFAIHIIPVGGRENDHLRPSAEEWKRFYTEVWDRAEVVWREYLDRIGAPQEGRKTLAEHIPFANPFRRVEHRGDLDEYCRRAADGVYWRDALTEKCRLIPTQAYILPDGSQHWCGSHAIQRPEPIGNVLTSSLRENIRRNLDNIAQLPGRYCDNCAGATCVINQMIERKLTEKVRELKGEAQPFPGAKREAM